MKADNNSSSNSKRFLWLDIARCIAIISVVANHAMSRSFHISSRTYDEYCSFGFFLSLLKAALYVFSRIGVPLFLMITGALLIGRDYENKSVLNRFIRKNWLPLLRTTIIWLGLMYWYLQLFKGSIYHKEGLERAIKVFIETLLFINVKSMASMWYMYMILCVYLIIPVISVAIRKLGDKYILSLLLIVIIAGMVFPNINTFLVSLGSTRKYIPAYEISNLFSIYFIYILSGWWVCQKKLELLSKRSIIILSILAFSLTTMFQLWIYMSDNSNYYVRYADIGILFTSSFVFEWIRRFSHRFANSNISLSLLFVRYVSKVSFGVYFIHICIMTGLKSYLDSYSSLWGFNRFIVLFCLSFISSLLVIKATEGITFFRKYLYIIKE